MARFAQRANGVVTRAELLSAGVSAKTIDRQVARGALIPRHRGVYRVGHMAPSVDATYMAAVKACGDDGLLSGLAAAYHLGLIRGHPPEPEVTAPTERRAKGVKTRRGRRQGTKVRGVPVTTVPETLVDLAAVQTAAELARSCHEAWVRYRVTPRHVEAVLERRPNATGKRKLLSVMRGETPVSLSVMEQVFFDELRAAKLPLPVTNKSVDGHSLDCRWPGLTAELDSYRFHNTRYAWEQDRERERRARKRRDEFRRYTWWDITEGKADMLADLRELLSRRPA